MAETRIVPLADEGLGNSACLADLVDGRALAVDMSRDLLAGELAGDLPGGPPDWSQATGLPLKAGE